MDVVEQLERENLSWADWMDELLRENFEKKARGWSPRRVEAAEAATRENSNDRDSEVAEPA